MRRDLGLLTSDGAVGVDKFEAKAAHMFHDACEQQQRVGTLIGRIGVGKKLPDIPGTSSAQDGICQGMSQDVGIGMTEQPFIVRNIDPADNTSAPFHQTMDIVAVSDAKLRGHADSPFMSMPIRPNHHSIDELVEREEHNRPTLPLDRYVILAKLEIRDNRLECESLAIPNFNGLSHRCITRAVICKCKEE